MADNQWEWPAQYPRYTPDPSQAPPAGYPATPPAGYPVPPPNAYQVPPPPTAYPMPAGYPAAPPPQAPPAGYQVAMNPAMRAASTDRERTVDVLKAGFAEGRLSQEEYNERMGRAYSARTYGELAALTADLPAGPYPTPTPWPVAVYQPPLPQAVAGTNSMAIAAMVLGVAEFFTAGLTAIPAVICGHIARRQMRLTTQRGDGLATGGLVLGYMAIIFWTVLIAASLVGVVISVTHSGQQVVIQQGVGGGGIPFPGNGP
ncbi:MAG: DUF1707 and DUF4190 domain-containing protein [Streptosporangiaceae bacterium]